MSKKTLCIWLGSILLFVAIGAVPSGLMLVLSPDGSAMGMPLEMLDNAPFKEKAQAKLLRGLPETSRRKSTLEMLVRLLDARYSEMSVHTLDRNLMLVDKISPTTYDQHNEEAICHVTRGLIQEAIYWATDQNPQIEETECKANGSSACEFRITFGD